MNKKFIKKILFLKIIISIKIIFIGTVFWQNIWDIEARFCEANPNNNEMNIITQANQETDICLVFENKSNIDTTLNIDFVDGAVTPKGNRSCFSSDKPRPNFWQYVLEHKNEVQLSGKSEKKQTYKIKFPTWFSGISNGCLIYSIKDNTESADTMRVVFNKAHSIDILVWWIPVDSKIKPKTISISWDQISNRILLNIENNWNINQSVNISGNISNIFGYSQEFQIPEFTINPQDSIQVTSQKILLPDYKWLFSIKLNISYKPNFNFHITNSNQKNEYTTPWNISISKILMLWNWFYLFSISIIIILITIIIFKKTKYNS